jgi:hypothetical protein
VAFGTRRLVRCNILPFYPQSRGLKAQVPVSLLGSFNIARFLESILKYTVALQQLTISDAPTGTVLHRGRAKGPDFDPRRWETC